MVMAYATVTGRIVVPGTTTGIPGELHATPLTQGGVLTFPTEDYTTIGPAVANVTGDGTLSPSLKIPTDVPGGTLWRLTFVPKGKGKLPVRLGEYEITASADIADLVPVTPTVITPALAAKIAEGALDTIWLADRAAADRALSASVARATYDDTRSTQFVETWANLTAWASNTQVQVNGGKVYANASTAGNAGINRGISLGAAEEARVVTTVVLPAASGEGGGIMVGFAKGAAGGSFGTGGNAMRGIYFDHSNGKVRKVDNGTLTDLSTSLTRPASYVVTLTADASYLTATARTTDGALEYRARWARDHATFPVNNLAIFNSDTRQLSGGYVGPLGLVRGIATVTPRTGIEGVGATVHWSSKDGAGVRVALPANYDSRVPAPVAMLFHGNGSDETHFADNGNGRAVANALTAAGYITVAAANTANVSTWGAQAGLDAYWTAYKFVRDRYAIGPVVFYGNSMGGIESLLTLADDRIPAQAWAGTVPTYDLAENYANPLFTATIKSAYGIAADGSDYAAKTAGHDPALLSPSAFRRLPMWMLVASDDAAVTPAPNGDALAADLAPVTTVTKVTVTGGHSTGSIASSAAAIVAFFNGVLGR